MRFSLRPAVCLAVAAVLLTSCAASAPTFRLGDNLFQALGSSSVEIIYLDPPATPFLLAPPPEAIGAAARQQMSNMYGPIGIAIFGYDPNSMDKAMEAAQAPLKPYQAQIAALDLKDRLFSSITGSMLAVPELSKAKVTRMPQPPGDTLVVPTHDLALHSDAGIVLVIAQPTAGLTHDAGSIGESLHMDVYAKPHPGQAVNMDAHIFYGSTKLGFGQEPAPDLDARLQKLFADDAAMLKSGLDSGSSLLGQKLAFYFHARPAPP